MKIVFMGTPHFAVPSLNRLIENGYDITAVVTQPDRKSGRGHKMTPPPVKTAALEHNIPVLQFEKIKTPEGVQALRKLKPDLIITAAFGQILSKEILDIPPMGCINVHASLLPGYRGAAPIQWAIINGEKQSGVTIMYMDVGLDTGDMISKVIVDIDDKMTGGMLYEKLAQEGANLLVYTLKEIQAGNASRTEQNDAESSYYPPLSKKLGLIDWNKPAREIYNLVRALNPVMSTYSHIDGNVYKIWDASLEQGSGKPGEIVCADAKKGLTVGTGDGLLRIEMMQAPGGKRMAPADFLRGKQLPGDHFE